VVKIKIELLQNGLNDQVIENGKTLEAYHLLIAKDQDRIREVIVVNLVREMLEIPRLLKDLVCQGILNTVHILGHLISMKKKVIGDAMTVAIGTLLHAHIAIAARYKNQAKTEGEDTKKKDLMIH